MNKDFDYHDYVFKNNKFIGEFEKMYVDSGHAIPWHQDKTAYAVYADIDIAILKRFKYKSICDIGCGLGYFTNRLHQELDFIHPMPRVTAIDISKTAVEKAKGLFPGIRFAEGDLTKERPFKREVFDLVVIRDILWYVSYDLEQFLKNTVSMVKKGGFLYVSNSFPESSKWVGQDIIDSPEALKNILLRYVKPVHYVIERDWNFNGRPLVHFLGTVNNKKA